MDLEKGYDIMVGYDHLIFRKLIESSGGLDGILRIDSHLNLGGGKECEKREISRIEYRALNLSWVGA